MQAVILAAGFGLRLKPYTDSLPKGLVPVLGRPLLEHIFIALPDSITSVIIVTGYRGEQIQNYFGKTAFGREINYISQDPINGTGTAIHSAKPFLTSERFLVVNGDDLYTKEDLTTLASLQRGILAWQSGSDTANGLTLNSLGNLEGMTDPGQSSPLVNCGAYLLDQNYFHYPLEEIIVHEKIEYSLPHTLAKQAGDESVEVAYAHFWQPIGTPEQLTQAEKMLSSLEKKDGIG
jgi:NDP-sugar pyrophosphorylase family protein